MEAGRKFKPGRILSHQHTTPIPRAPVTIARACCSTVAPPMRVIMWLAALLSPMTGRDGVSTRPAYHERGKVYICRGGCGFGYG